MADNVIPVSFKELGPKELFFDLETNPDIKEALVVTIMQDGSFGIAGTNLDASDFSFAIHVLQKELFKLIEEENDY